MQIDDLYSDFSSTLQNDIDIIRILILKDESFYICESYVGNQYVQGIICPEAKTFEVCEMAWHICNPDLWFEYTPKDILQLFTFERLLHATFNADAD